LKEWIAPVVAIDLRIGGTISTNYDNQTRIGGTGASDLRVINYLEKHLITLKVKLNDKFSKKAREEDQNLQEIIQIVDLRNGKTKIVSSMVGWGTVRGEDLRPMLSITIEDNEPRGRPKWKRFTQLLIDPQAGRCLVTLTCRILRRS
jgi:hypothetical protein